MARSRSRGSRSVTSRSPIVILPPEIVSRPASIRRSVVLPQPDGPTRTMNSPLSIVRLTSSTAVTPPENTLLTPSKTTLLTVRQDNASMTTITAVEALDIRFPTSRSLDGSDAMNPDPDYSVAYVIFRTDDEAATGHGFTFTIGRGNEICVAAIEALRPLVVGRSLEDVFAKREGKPLWKLLVDLSPEEIVACVDFRYLTDALTHDEALELLRPNVSTKCEREAEMRRDGFPAYTTSFGWLGYPDEKMRRLCRDAVAEGWTQFKMKVGANLEDDVRRAALLR